ncbi:MAG: EAL domain-containing protein [Gammaproteobacteria bacterium]|nr:EAL domain-containing protein [Gammaproteobacteria bacterium]
MNSNRTCKIFPLSITNYGILFILLGILLFGLFGWHALTELSELQNEAHKRNITLAKEELHFIVNGVVRQFNTIATLYSEWDETQQQLNVPTNYIHWRKHQALSVNFKPPYVVALELYDIKGVAIAPPMDKDFPAQIKSPLNNVGFFGNSTETALLYFHPINLDKNHNRLAGFVAIKIHFIEALIHSQRLKHIDVNSIRFKIVNKPIKDANDIINMMTFSVLPNREFNQLGELIFDTLARFAMIGTGLAIIFWYLLIVLVGLPSRRLSHLIDTLRQGSFKFDADKSESPKLPVAEFEKIRLSLHEYQHQLDNSNIALRDNEMRMRAVLDNVVDGIITIDEHGTIEAYNPATEKIFGILPGEIIGQKITLLISAGSQKDYFTYSGRCSQSLSYCEETLNTCKLIGRRKDGSKFPIEIALSPMQVADIRLFIVVVRDITERKRAEERLVYLANYDELTGLPNRTLARDRLENATTRAKRDGRLAAVISIDLDQFKNINDTLGHYAGDQLLLSATRRLLRPIRELDTVARLGGDEFMVIVENIGHMNEITSIVEKFLHAFDKPFTLDQQDVYITASAGIAIYPLDDSDTDNLVKNADTAMFRAKAKGGNSYEYFTADMNTQAMERLTLENALRQALTRNEFELYYQPRVNLETEIIVGMEALLRWHHPTLGCVSPVKFIPVLEETGLIVPVGEWVLKTACEQTKHWLDIGDKNLRVAVNLSVRQFQQNDLVDRFTNIFRSTGLDPSHLELEITEGLLVENVSAAIDMLQAFHNLGIHISIDDFGTGYSSLSYLKRFPINTLKIDRTFVHDVTLDSDDAAITTAIVALARSLRLNVTAEGIETEPQLRFLRQLCDEAQGFYFNKPLKSSEFESLITGKHRKNLKSNITGVRS